MEKPHLYELIAQNKRHSYLLVLIIIGLFAGIGLGAGYYYGYLWQALAFSLIVALLYALFAIKWGDGLVMLSMGAKLADPKKHYQLYNVVEEMSLASGLPMPKVYLMDSPASNAFATGISPQKASIAVTRDLLKRLKREELQGVIAHEMAHIKNFDTRYAVLMAVMVGSIALICDGLLRLLLHGGRKSSDSKSSQAEIFLWLGVLLLALLAPLVAKIIQLAMSRRREYLADQSAVELTRNPEGLAKALEKIAADPDELRLANRGTQHLFIINPIKAAKAHKRKACGKKLKKEKDSWWSTHPPLAKRLKILRELSGTVNPERSN